MHTYMHTCMQSHIHACITHSYLHAWHIYIDTCAYVCMWAYNAYTNENSLIYIRIFTTWRWHWSALDNEYILTIRIPHLCIRKSTHTNSSASSCNRTNGTFQQGSSQQCFTHTTNSSQDLFQQGQQKNLHGMIAIQTWKNDMCRMHTLEQKNHTRWTQLNLTPCQRMN